MAKTEAAQDTEARIQALIDQIARLEQERVRLYSLLSPYLKYKEQQMHHTVGKWQSLAAQYPNDVWVQKYADVVSAINERQIERDTLRTTLLPAPNLSLGRVRSHHRS
jgi:uncharacterized protein (DUF3084 family)